MNIVDWNLKTNSRLMTTSLTQSQWELLSIMSQNYHNISITDTYGFLVESILNIDLYSTRESDFHYSSPLSKKYSTQISDDLITTDIDTYE